MSIAIKDFDVSEFTLIEVEEQDEAEVVAENAGAVVIVEGKPGKQGEPGKDGYTPIKGIDYFDGAPGKDGENATPEQIAEAVDDYFEENPVSGDENEFVVTFWVSGENQENVTADKTYAEIDAAYNAGKKVVGLLSGNANAEFKLSMFNIFGYTFTFIDPSVDTNENCSVAVYEINYSINGTIKFTMGGAQIPTKTSQLENDSGYITLNDIPESGGGEVTAESVRTALGYVPANEADIPTKPEDVGAEKSGAVSAHNVANDSHNDIRLLISALTTKINNFLDVDDTTADELSEIIQLIKDNAKDIETITAGKVNVADIINNLTTNVANKPLSAAQGVVLKGLIDNLVVVANNATTTARNAETTATEAKNLASGASQTATNASNKVDDLEGRMNSGEFKGEPGEKGADGKDYVLTDADKTEIAETVKAEVPLVKVAEQPTFVNSVDEMTDTSKVYLMPDGYLYALLKGNGVTILNTNDFTVGAVDSNGVPSGSGTSRIYTSAVLSLVDNTVKITPPKGYQYLVYFYKSNTPSASSLAAKTSWRKETLDDITAVSLASGSLNGVTHCRINFRDEASSGSLSLTEYFDDFVASEPIVLISKNEVKQWQSTGFSYNQPADYEDRIVALERVLEGIEYVAF